jgi:hypothetical protein
VAAIDDRYKLVLSVNDRPWLFDHENDPDELLNFFDRPGTAGATKRLADALKAYASKSEDPFFLDPKISSSLEQCRSVKP